MSSLTYLRTEFVSMNYRRRFSRLNRYTKEQYVLRKIDLPGDLKQAASGALGSPVSIHLQTDAKAAINEKIGSLTVRLVGFQSDNSTALAQLTPSVASVIAKSLATSDETTLEFVAGLLGSDHKRSDLIDFANYQLRIADWVGPLGLWLSTLPLIGWPTPRVRLLQSVFGRDLLVTIYWHRRFSARVFRGSESSPDYDYYRRYYGLLSPRLERLTDALLRVGARTGAVAEEDLDEAFKLESWLWENHAGTETSPRTRKPRWGKKRDSQ